MRENERVGRYRTFGDSGMRYLERQDGTNRLTWTPAAQ